MAEATSKRPEVVGQMLNQIAKQDPEILQSVIEVMEAEKLLQSSAQVEVVPKDASYIVQLDGHPARADSIVPQSNSSTPAEPHRQYLSSNPNG